MVYMAEEMDKRSRGRVRIDVYPSEQLGNERELLEQLQVGALAMAKVSAAVLESFQPSAGVFGLPYLIPDENLYWEILKGDLGRRLLDESATVGLKGLCYYDSGSRSFYTRNRPIHTPADLKGLKIRVQPSPTAVELIRAMGGAATPIPWGELYSALQQGVVDGAENNPPSFYLSRHYEVCRYYTLNQHTRVPDVVAMSLEVWNRLPLDMQELLEEIAWESVDQQRRLWTQSVEDSMREVKAAGVEVIYPDLDPFVEAASPLLDRYEEEKEYGHLIREIRTFIKHRKNEMEEAE